MKLSARNQIKGEVVGVQKGQTRAAERMHASAFPF